MSAVSLESGQTVSDFDEEIKSIRSQLSEQNKSFNARTGRKVELTRDLSGYFQKLAEIENTYATSLERLHEKYSQPRKSGVAAMASKLTRRGTAATDDQLLDETVGPQAPTQPTGLSTDIWTILLEQTKRKAESRFSYASSLTADIKNNLDILEKEVSASSKKCVELGAQLQDDMLKTFKSCEHMMKAYHTQQSKALSAEEKFDKAQEKGQASSKKGEKLREKFVMAEKKATGTRNEYLLALAASNAYKKRYYKHELGALVDVMDRRFHDTLRQLVSTFKDGCLEADKTSMECATVTFEAAEAIDQTRDKVKFFNDQQMIFMDRKLFEFLRYSEDKINSIQFASDTLGDLSLRYRELESQIFQLDQSIGQEKETLKAIEHMQEENTAALDKSATPEDVAVKPALMFTETYQKIALKGCLRTAALAQFNLLGEALQSHRPEPREFDGGVTVKFGESTEPAVDTRGLDGSLKKPSLRKTRPRSQDVGALAATPKSVSTPDVVKEDVAGETGSVEIADKTDDGSDSDGSFDGPSPPGTPELPRTVALAEEASKKAGVFDEEKKRANSIASELKTRTTAPETQKPAEVEASTSKSTPGSPEKKPEKVKPPRPSPFKRPSVSRPEARSRTESTISQGVPEEQTKYYKFGCNLIESNNALGVDVPHTVKVCIRELEARGLKDDGLFRVPGSSSQIDDLRLELERGKDPLAGPEKDTFSSDSVAGCLKLFLRQLEDPVMTRKLYSAFVQIGKLGNRRNQLLALREATKDHMPAEHCKLLSVLMPFLKKVSANSEFNRMSASNLALVFGPTLMPAPENDMTAMLRDATTINTVMTLLIENHSFIFGDSDTLPEEPTTPPAVICHARAKFDYSARSDTELSFKAGDMLDVYDKADTNWWNGSLNGKEGFIAAAYVVEWSDEKQKEFEERRLSRQSSTSTSPVKSAVDEPPASSPPSTPASSVASSVASPVRPVILGDIGGETRTESARASMELSQPPLPSGEAPAMPPVPELPSPVATSTPEMPPPAAEAVPATTAPTPPSPTTPLSPPPPNMPPPALPPAPETATDPSPAAPELPPPADFGSLDLPPPVLEPPVVVNETKLVRTKSIGPSFAPPPPPPPGEEDDASALPPPPSDMM